MSTLHEYESDFFDYINAGSLASAAIVCPLVVDWLAPQSLLDVGAGAGAWCRVWSENGVPEVMAVDGDYVDKETLLIPETSFHSHDLSRQFDLGRTFDLVTSLEVAEHVAEHSADVFVDNLVRHGSVVLFSAAVPGQGGEFHVNEQPPSYWRAKFAARGFRCFDPLRRRILRDPGVEPWYRYNTLIYVHESRLSGLNGEIAEHEVPMGQEIEELAPLIWRTRNTILRTLPRPLVEVLAQAKHTYYRMRRS